MEMSHLLNPEGEALAKRLLKDAKSIIGKHNLTLAPDGLEALQNLFMEGALTLSKTRTISGKSMPSEVSDNMKRLVDTMIEIAHQEGVSIIDDSILQKALFKICPFFPFC